MKNTEHIEKINEYIAKCLSNGSMNHADLIEIFKHNQHHTRLVRVSHGVHSPQYYYQNDKVITLLGAKFVINEPPPIC